MMAMGQETLEAVETNDLGQVKIVSSAKTGKWVWVNAKHYRGILKRRLARLKWEQTRKKMSQRESTRVLRKKQHSKSHFCKHVATSPKEKEKSLMIMPYIVPHPHLSLGHLIFM
jgi:hypothetical protein